MKTVKVFKLVKVLVDGKLASWNETAPKVRVLYTPGKWATPQVRGTPLYAFDTQEHALRRGGYSLAHGNLRDTQIWEAEADVRKSFDPVAYDQSLYGTTPEWQARWKNWKTKRSTRFEGFLLCGKIKLTRRIK